MQLPTGNRKGHAALLDNPHCFCTADLVCHKGTDNTPMQFKGESKKNTQTTIFVAWALAELR
jgi:hypothetical protein